MDVHVNFVLRDVDPREWEATSGKTANFKDPMVGEVALAVQPARARR